MIGTSRETVSRLFADLQGEAIHPIEGPRLVILNKFALEGMVQA